MRCLLTAICIFFVTPTWSAGHVDSIILNAEKYVGMNEFDHTDILQELMDVDPIATPWCAAFVNSVLEESGIQGTDSLLARSFLKFGEPVDEPIYGDLVIFPRNLSWQGHVGFFLVSYIEDGIEYYAIIGGNQDDEVSYKLFRADEAIGIRRY